MDKQLVLAVAGAGKTKLLIDKLDRERRALIITHTTNNFRNINSRIATTFGFLPHNIQVMTYFSFLYGFCFKPFLLKKTGVRGINFDRCGNIRAVGRARYIDSNQRAYANRLAKLIQESGAGAEVTARIGKYFDLVMVDEVQDFAGNDFNFLPVIASAETDALFVGDFFQHTYDTSRDGGVRKNLHKDYGRYIAECEGIGLTVDRETLRHSYRCGPELCNYITDSLGIAIGSHRQDTTGISFLERESEIREIYNDPAVIKLFYQNADGHHACHSRNWGASKGEDHYTDVCVVLNQTSYRLYRHANLRALRPSTRNKLYVAMTRCRGSLYFVEEKALRGIAPKAI
ncbi:MULTISPECIES: DNA helicase UvrD [Rhodomicrobium]|uniref:DNA helicase UvrD n=1 Tax=Rhodomicrobium TaxID=1068 RepID=UPI000B4BF606|nr:MULTISPECIES: DNA helicase UvrD [Rhodomicrobium]